jgi:hypothetical protein
MSCEETSINPCKYCGTFPKEIKDYSGEGVDGRNLASYYRCINSKCKNYFSQSPLKSWNAKNLLKNIEYPCISCGKDPVRKVDPSGEEDIYCDNSCCSEFNKHYYTPDSWNISNYVVMDRLESEQEQETPVMKAYKYYPCISCGKPPRNWTSPFLVLHPSAKIVYCNNHKCVRYRKFLSPDEWNIHNLPKEKEPSEKVIISKITMPQKMIAEKYHCPTCGSVPEAIVYPYVEPEWSIRINCSKKDCERNYPHSQKRWMEICEEKESIMQEEEQWIETDFNCPICGSESEYSPDGEVRCSNQVSCPIQLRVFAMDDWVDFCWDHSMGNSDEVEELLAEYHERGECQECGAEPVIMHGRVRCSNKNCKNSVTIVPIQDWFHMDDFGEFIYPRQSLKSLLGLQEKSEVKSQVKSDPQPDSTITITSNSGNTFTVLMDNETIGTGKSIYTLQITPEI